MRAGTFLGKRDDRKAVCGWLLLLTMIRPSPYEVFDPAWAGRIVDVVWFLLAGVLLFSSLPLRRNGEGSAPIFWIAAIMYSTLISLFFEAVIFDNAVIRDIFELYRAPYYMLVLALSMQFLWTREDLLRYFVRPLFAGLGIMAFISFLQMQSYSGAIKEKVGYIYYLKSQGFAVLPDGLYYLRNNGTFANPNHFSVALTILLPFAAAAYFLNHGFRYRMIVFAGLFAIFVMILTTGSRVGGVSMALMFVVYLLLVLCEKFRRGYPIRGNKPARGYIPIVFLAIFIIAAIGLVSPKLHRWEKTKSDYLTQGGLYGIESFATKIDHSLKFVSEAVEKSPLFGLGPAKGEDNYLGDNQYARYFYRYGIVGLAVWCCFWMSLFWRAFVVWKRPANEVQMVFSRAVLSVVPIFLIACAGGAFFDATQIMTLLLILTGIALCAEGDKGFLV